MIQVPLLTPFYKKPRTEKLNTKVLALNIYISLWVVNS